MEKVAEAGSISREGRRKGNCGESIEDIKKESQSTLSKADSRGRSHQPERRHAMSTRGGKDVHGPKTDCHDHGQDKGSPYMLGLSSL